MTVKTILCVDDEPNVLSALRRLLRKDSVEVICAGGAQEGLTILATRRVDIVISDYMMPGKNGVQFLAEVMRIAPESRRFLLSGYGDQGRIEEALALGEVHEVFAKPWDNDVLRSKLLGSA